jgi:hypothetical protein
MVGAPVINSTETPESNGTGGGDGGGEGGGAVGSGGGALTSGFATSAAWLGAKGSPCGMTTVMNPVTDRTPSNIFRVLSTRPSLFGCKGGIGTALRKY